MRSFVLYSLHSIIWVIKARRMRGVGHVACVGERKGAYRVLEGKPERRKLLGRIVLMFQEVGLWGTDRINLADDGDK
jgi:hypothetical protein